MVAKLGYPYNTDIAEDDQIVTGIEVIESEIKFMQGPSKRTITIVLLGFVCSLIIVPFANANLNRIIIVSSSSVGTSLSPFLVEVPLSVAKEIVEITAAHSAKLGTMIFLDQLKSPKSTSFFSALSNKIKSLSFF